MRPISYPRVWTLQHMYTQGLKTKIDQGQNDFPVFLTPTYKLTINDVEQGLRNHYQGTSHIQPIITIRKNAYRPISYSEPKNLIFFKLRSHHCQLRLVKRNTWHNCDVSIKCLYPLLSRHDTLGAKSPNIEATIKLTTNRKTLADSANYKPFSQCDKLE